jgi:hypothetical protein
VLRESAPPSWRWRAQFHRTYAEHHASRGDQRAAEAVRTRGDFEEAHARMAERGEWALNEKGLLARAGMDTSSAATATAGVDFSSTATAPVPLDPGR